MDQAVSTLIAAAIGASAGIGGGVSLEAFKRRQDRRGVASALAGAVEFEIWAIRRRGHIEMFREELARLEAGEVRKFYGLIGKDQTRNPIADAYIDKYGVLGGDLPARVIAFFQTMWALRVDVSRVVAGDFPDPSIMVKVIKEDIPLAEETVQAGERLAADLRVSATVRFGSHWRWRRQS